MLLIRRKRLSIKVIHLINYNILPLEAKLLYNDYMPVCMFI